MRWARRSALVVLAAIASSASAQIGNIVPSVTNAPPGSEKADAREADAILRGFRFHDGASLPAVRMHYRTLGTPRRDAAGRIVNAALMLHGTGKSGELFLSPDFKAALFDAGHPLDIGRYYVILPDALGTGRSAKPSDGLKAAFPRYNYADQVNALHELLTRHLGVQQLQIVIGASMGCMQAYLIGTNYPDFARALLPISCAPRPITGVNRMFRRVTTETIRRDPAWMQGNYKEQPRAALRAALGSVMIATYGLASPLGEKYDSVASTDHFLDEQLDRLLSSSDANDVLYQFDASRDYDPAPMLKAVRARVTAINSSKDKLYPANVGQSPIFTEAKGNRFILADDPAGYGHFISYHPSLWADEVKNLLSGQ